MKKILVALIILCCMVASGQKRSRTLSRPSAANSEQSAAPNPLYAFTTTLETYVPISNGTSLTSGKKWDDADFDIPLGFNFKLYGLQNDSVVFSEGSYAFIDDGTSLITLASPIFEDLCDRAFHPSTDNEGDPGGMSAITYTVTGAAGSRICKIQVDNAGFFGELAVNDTSVSYVNFQLWLYENGDIDFRYGAVDIQNPDDNLLNPAGFICGLGEKVDLNTAANQSSNLLNGPHNNPAMVALTNGNEVVTGAIQSGRVYKFTRVVPNPVGIVASGPLKQLDLFPNPASRTLYCKGEEEIMKSASICFWSLDGRLIASKKLEQAMDLSDMVKGVYFIKAQSAGGEYIYSGKLVIVD